MDMELRGKVAIITGGSLGIGRAIAERFLKEGCTVILAGRKASRLRKTVKELSWKRKRVAGIPTDVSRITDVRRLIRQVLKKYRSIDILINAAGVQGPIGLFERSDIKDWIRGININLVGTVLCCRLALPFMIKKNYGKIINFSGGGATSPRPHFTAYAVAKTAVVRFTEILAQEIGSRHIDVNAIAPGAINTRMLGQILAAGSKEAGQDEFRAAKERSIKGGASMDEVVDLALFLSSKPSDGLSGKLISAVWDDWRKLKKRKKKLMKEPLYTLRRIDGRNFIEVRK